MKAKFVYILLALTISILVVFILSAVSGAASLSLGNIADIILFKSENQMHQAIFWSIRLPRIVMSLLVGASLAISGVAMQGLFRNPLADPSLIGITAGSSLFAAIAIVLGVGALSGILGAFSLSVSAFFGAALTAFLIFQLSGIDGSRSTNTILLAGIAIQAIAFSFTGLLHYITNDQELRDLTFWTLGSLGGASWMINGILCITTILSAIMLFKLAPALNAFSMGEKEATFLGVNVSSLKVQIMIYTTLAVGTATAFSGSIGFIGLVVPHIMRMALGADHKVLIPASALAGGVLLSAADTLARTIIMPAELPIGIITALIGTPVFFWILITNARSTRRKLAF